MTIHFLAYVNRSGSTLLARKLSEYEGIGVGIESDIPDSVISNFKADDERSLDRWLETCYAYPKFAGWNIQREQLRERLLQGGFPIDYGAFLRETFRLYFRDADVEAVVHKSRHHFKSFLKNHSLFPESKLIYIDRDPRAIFNSMSTSIDSRTGKIMKDDVVRFALQYVRNKNLLHKLQSDTLLGPRVVYVTYEELILHEETVMGELLGEFGLKPVRRTESRYMETIPESQKHLHTNLNSGNKVERIDGWKSELGSDDQRFLTLALRGHFDVETSGTFVDVVKASIERPSFAKNFLKFTVLRMRQKLLNQ